MTPISCSSCTHRLPRRKVCQHEAHVFRNLIRREIERSRHGIPRTGLCTDQAATTACWLSIHHDLHEGAVDVVQRVAAARAFGQPHVRHHVVGGVGLDAAELLGETCTQLRSADTVNIIEQNLQKTCM